MAKQQLDPIWTPEAQQMAFRSLLEAMSRPGTIATFHAASALLSILSTLVDHTTSLNDAHGLLTESNWRLLGVARASWTEADFVLVNGHERPPLHATPRLGTLASPERSATILLVGCTFGAGGPRFDLSGPGVDGLRQLQLGGVHPEWWERRSEWTVDFPMGVDFILLDEHRAVCLPRRTGVERWAM